MIRFLLTLLALVSGLAATGGASACQFGPARAEVASVCQVQGEARVSAHVKAHAAALMRPALPSLILTAAAPLAAAAPVATVHTRIDRARE